MGASDRTPRSAAFDLGLQCLPMSLLRDARHRWVNVWRLMVAIGQSFVYCRASILLITDYSTKKGVLLYSQMCK